MRYLKDVAIACIVALLSIAGAEQACARTAYEGNEGGNCGDSPTPGPPCQCYQVFVEDQFHCGFCAPGRWQPGDQICDTDIPCLQ